MYKYYTSYYLVNFRYNSTLIPIFRNATPNGELAKGDFFAASNSFEIERAMFNRGSGEEIANFFKPRQQAVTRIATQNNMEPEAYALGGGGGSSFGGFGGMSDSYSFWDMDAEALSAKGTGGTRQMHNYVSLNHADTINTPQDDADYKSSKIPESVTVEQLMQQREQDIVATQGQQQRF